MTENVGFTVMTDVHDRAVLCVELPYRVVTSYAAVLTEGHDDLVLKYCFCVNIDRLLVLRVAIVVALIILVTDSPIGMTNIKSVPTLDNVWVVLHRNLFREFIYLISKIGHIRETHRIQTIATSTNTVIHR